MHANAPKVSAGAIFSQGDVTNNCKAQNHTVTLKDMFACMCAEIMCYLLLLIERAEARYEFKLILGFAVMHRHRYHIWPLFDDFHKAAP